MGRDAAVSVRGEIRVRHKQVTRELGEISRGWNFRAGERGYISKVGARTGEEGNEGRERLQENSLPEQGGTTF